jgi:hypothetical protein
MDPNLWPAEFVDTAGQPDLESLLIAQAAFDAVIRAMIQTSLPSWIIPRSIKTNPELKSGIFPS